MRIGGRAKRYLGVLGRFGEGSGADVFIYFFVQVIDVWGFSEGDCDGRWGVGLFIVGRRESAEGESDCWGCMIEREAEQREL